MKNRLRLAVRKGIAAYAIGAALVGMSALGAVGTAQAEGLTLPGLDTTALTLDLTPVKDVYNLTVAASLGIAGYRKAGVAAKKW